jgi:hypothetical protein
MFFPPVNDYLWALYPELHYRFRYFKFSRYYRRQPEIVVDIPQRVVNEPTPVVVLAWDAHLFPLEFTGDLKLEIFSWEGDKTEEKGRKSITLLPLPIERIASPWWFTIHYVDLPLGKYHIFTHLSYRCAGKEYRIVNHNFPGLKVSPLVVKRMRELVKPEGFLLGDLHCHSAYTHDQVEFGMPLEPLAVMAKASGMDFAGITDHTYDMDDDLADYLRQDPEENQWRIFNEELVGLNARKDSTLAHLLPGQEITVRNYRERNVHLLLLGDDRLFPGSGDSAEKWFKTRSEHSIAEILSLKSSPSIAGAGHPRTKAKLLERVLLNRGEWGEMDFLTGITGVQIANGDEDASLREGLKYWEEAISRGRQIALWGGNDAHGNFNRFRQIKIPMLFLQEKDEHIFGRNFTGIYSPAGVGGLMEGLGKGNTFISNGLILDFKANGAHPGDTIPAGRALIEIDLLSEEARSRIKDLILVLKDEEGRREQVLRWQDFHSRKIEYALNLKSGWIYLKGENLIGEYYISSAVYVK